MAQEDFADLVQDCRKGAGLEYDEHNTACSPHVGGVPLRRPSDVGVSWLELAGPWWGARPRLSAARPQVPGRPRTSRPAPHVDAARGITLAPQPLRVVSRAQHFKRRRARSQLGVLESRSRDEPHRLRSRRDPAGDRPRRKRRSLGDDQRRLRQRTKVVDHHRTALMVQRHRQQLGRRGAPRALGGRQRLPALRRRIARRERPVTVRPGLRVGRVQAQAVSPCEQLRNRRLSRARRATDPQYVPHAHTSVASKPLGQ